MATFVRGVGPPSAKMVLVGEAPGRMEERLGEPFVGGSGALLTQMLFAAGINRKECYVTNVVKERPPGNDFSVFYVDGRKTQPTEKLEMWQRKLRQELEDRRGVNVIVALGEEALRALTGYRGITKWRGSIIGTPLGKVVPTYHPAMVMRKYEARRVVEHDLRRALEESRSPELSLPQHHFIIDPSFEEVMAAMGSIQKGMKVSFDIETLGERVRCVGLSVNASEAICIPFVSTKMPKGSTVIATLTDTPFHSHWGEAEELAILKELERILGDEEIPLIAQNFPFDASFYEREFGIVCRGLWMDTMVAQHCCYCELPKGLDFLCSFYTRVPYYGDYNASSDVETWTYNCYDAAVTYEVAMELEKEMKELGV